MRVTDTDTERNIAYWQQLLSVIARQYMDGASHDFDHLDRVYRMVEVIAHDEGGDAEVLVAATYLHDIGRKQEAETGVDHAVVGAQLAERILREVGFPSEKIDMVVACIRTHRFRGSDAPATIEDKVLFDADKLDAMGAIGIARAYAHAGEYSQRLFLEPDGHSVHHNSHETYSPVIEYELKLKMLKDRLYTEAGRRIARNRHDYMAQFFDRLRQEIDGIV